MDENNNTNVTTEQNDVTTPDEGTAKLDEVMARLAETEKALAEQQTANMKLKNANDKLSKENAEKKRLINESMTADEQKKAQEEEERQALLDRLEQAEAEVNHSRAVNAYKDISDEKAVEQLIEAVNDKDHATIAKLIANEIAIAKKEQETQLLKERPQIPTGAGSTTMTKDEIMAIKDPEERQRKIAENKALFIN